MPFSYKSFKGNKDIVIDNGVNPTQRIFVITPILQSNSETVAFAISTNLPANTTLNYVIAGAQNTDFTDGTASGSFTLDSNGNATVGKTLDITANYSNSNVEIQFVANTVNGDMIKEAETNVIIRPATAFSATSSNVTYPYTGIALHTFTADDTFTVTQLDERTTVSNIRHLLVGGGGAGGNASRLGVDCRVGGGGGAGGVIDANLSSANYSLSTYSVTIGEGGANGNIYISNVTTATNGNSTTLGNANITLFEAFGGGHGADFHTNGLTFTRSVAGQDGGSGGGASTSIYTTGGDTLSAQGSHGGNTQPAAGFSAGSGGGGYSQTPNNPQVGANVYVGDGSEGGNGYITNITGSNITLAGGGGGGSSAFTNGLPLGVIELLPNASGGAGGGGAGGRGTSFGVVTGPVFPYDPVDPNQYMGSGTPGIANTGGGGGGGGMDTKKIVSGSGDGKNTGGRGGSGVAYLSYAYQYRLFELPA